MNETVSSGKKRGRIPKCKREECLDLFRSGCGYKEGSQIIRTQWPIQSESISDGIRQGIYPGLTEERIYPLTIMEADPRCNTGIPSEIDRWPVAPPMVTGLVF